MSGYVDLYSLNSTLLVSSWLSTILYTLEVTIVIYYFSKCSATRSTLALVAGLFLIDTLCVLAVFANIWITVLTSAPAMEIPPGVPTTKINSIDDLPRVPQPWFVSVVVLTTAVISVIEKLFLIRRFYKLSANQVITAILLISVIGHGGFSLFSVVYGAVRGPDDALVLGFLATLVSAVISTTVDTLVPLSIVWLLHRITPPRRQCRERILSILVNAMSSGCVAGIYGYIYLITVITRSLGFIPMINTIGRIYSLTVLTNIVVGSKKKHPIGNPESNPERFSQLNMQIPMQIIPGQWSPVVEINATTYIERRCSIGPDDRQDKDHPEETTPGRDTPMSKHSFSPLRSPNFKVFSNE